MKRKLVALLCTAAMAATMLTGCGNDAEKTEESVKQSGGQTEAEDSSEEESAAGDQEAEAPSEEAELEYVELKWDVLSFQMDNIKDLDMIQSALDEYFLEKLNCKVVLNIMDWGTYGDTVPTKLMSGEEVDLCTINTALSYNNYASMGAFYPIDTLWDEYGTEVKGLFNEGVWESLTINDHIYAVPILKDNCYIIGYIYNATLAEELGLDMEQGWSGLKEMEDFMIEALALRDEKFPEYKGMPLVASHADFSPFYMPMETFGCDRIAVCNIPGKEIAPEYGTNTVFNAYESEEYREICLLKQRLVAAGVNAYDSSIYETSLTAEPSTLLDTAWGYTWISEELYGDQYKTKLVLFDNPWTDSGNYTGAMTAIGANCKNPERAMMALQLVNTDPYVATLLRFGIEGEHWEYDENHKMQLTNRNADVSNPGWLQWYGPFYGNLTIVEAPESYGGPDGVMLQKMAEYNNKAILAAHMGFVMDTSAIENELSACNNVLSEYGNLLWGGQLESQEAVNEAVDKLIEKLKENGSDKIVEEVQRQIDAWEASK